MSQKKKGADKQLVHWNAVGSDDLKLNLAGVRAAVFFFLCVCLISDKFLVISLGAAEEDEQFQTRN